MSHWNPISEPQDFVDFSGVRSPGLAEVIGSSSPRAWDERESYAVGGAFLVFHSKKLSHFSVKLRLYTIEDWEGWWALYPLVSKLPRRGVPAKAINVTHPLLAANNIHSAVVEELMQPEQTGDGEWTIEIKMIEFRAPVITVAKADGAQATPADPEDAQLAELNTQSTALDQAFEATP